VQVPEGCESVEREAVRLFDVLWMFSCAVKGTHASRRDGESLFYKLHVVTHVRDLGKDGLPPFVEVQAHAGPGDDGEPVLTFMLPGED
jgi:hypothetical protein